MTAATLIALLSTGAMAQRFPNVPQQPGHGQRDYDRGNDRRDYNQEYGQYNYDYDDNRFDQHLDWWDRELNLSRRQEREIRRIRGRFEQQSRTINPRDPRQRDAFRQLRQREFFDMMAVLDSRQRDRVIEHMRPYEQVASRGRGYRNGNGRYGNGRGGNYGPYGY